MDEGRLSIISIKCQKGKSQTRGVVKCVTATTIRSNRLKLDGICSVQSAMEKVKDSGEDKEVLPVKCRLLDEMHANIQTCSVEEIVEQELSESSFVEDHFNDFLQSSMKSGSDSQLYDDPVRSLYEDHTENPPVEQTASEPCHLIEIPETEYEDDVENIIKLQQQVEQAERERQLREQQEHEERLERERNQRMEEEREKRINELNKRQSLFLQKPMLSLRTIEPAKTNIITEETSKATEALLPKVPLRNYSDIETKPFIIPNDQVPKVVVTPPGLATLQPTPPTSKPENLPSKNRRKLVERKRKLMKIKLRTIDANAKWLQPKKQSSNLIHIEELDNGKSYKNGWTSVPMEEENPKLYKRMLQKVYPGNRGINHLSTEDQLRIFNMVYVASLKKRRKKALRLHLIDNLSTPFRLPEVVCQPPQVTYPYSVTDIPADGEVVPSSIKEDNIISPSESVVEMPTQSFKRRGFTMSYSTYRSLNHLGPYAVGSCCGRSPQRPNGTPLKQSAARCLRLLQRQESSGCQSEDFSDVLPPCRIIPLLT